MDVAAWLRGLGLGRYEAAFRDNDIAADVLPRLTADDLKDIGVASVGDRRRLLDGIAALREAPSVTAAAASSAAPAPADAEAGHGVEGHGAERRQLTVLFCDLAGSTPLSARLDPEDLREVMAAYHRAVAEVMERHGGYVAKFLGDGVLAYFGWPRAHEDDAERAVRAGLAASAAVARLETAAGPLAARVGIATGPVVVGDVVGEGEARERGAVGETPNLAARLQALAEPGTVVVGAGTRRLVAGLFDLEDLGARALKGFATPVPAWRVLGPSRAAGRFEAREAAAGLTPLVGRAPELALLLDRWGRARVGEGQLVLLGGEPGVGKSRLVRALCERLGGAPHTVLAYQCSPLHADTALHPVIAQLERAAGFRPDDAAGAKLDKLEALLGRGAADPAAVAPLFAELLSIPADGRYPPLDLAAARRRERLIAALLDQLAGLAAARPVLAVFEDAHWMDPTTAELVGLAAERARGLPAMLLVTFRPEFAPPWARHAHATLLTVGRLGGREVAAMIETVAGERALPAAVAAEVAAKADGVPLFVEELTRAVLEAHPPGEEADRGGVAASAPPTATAVPATLQDSLMARLDRAPAARELAQLAAAIGREFRHDLLAAVAPLGGRGLEEVLAPLIEAGLVFRRGAALEAAYAFKHALVRDAAYESLLRGKRRELHARIARALEERFLGTAEREPELLAHHCAEAGLAERAAAYRHQAGRRAMARSAMAEAVAQLRAGLDALAGLPDGPGSRRLEFDLQLALATALIATSGYAAPETGEALARARELCREDDDPHRHLPVLNGQVLFHHQRGEPRAAHAIAAEMLERAERSADGALLIPAHRAMSLTSWHLGRFAAMRVHAERVLSFYDPAQHRGLASLYGFDQRSVSLSYLAMALLVLGHPDQARRCGEELLAWTRHLQHPNSLAQALHILCYLHFAARDATAARRAAEEQISLAAEHGLPFFLGHGRLFRGLALVEQGLQQEGLADVERGRAELLACGSVLQGAGAGIEAAAAHARAGHVQEALRWTAEACATMEDGPNLWKNAEKPRCRGEVLLLLPEPDRAGAEACFRRAVEVARAQGARWWELRAARDLARLLRDQGRAAEARDLLAPVYASFTEGFAFPDLVEARALLEDLGARPADGGSRRKEEVRTPQGPDRLREPIPGR